MIRDERTLRYAMAIISSGGGRPWRDLESSQSLASLGIAATGACTVALAVQVTTAVTGANRTVVQIDANSNSTRFLVRITTTGDVVVGRNYMGSGTVSAASGMASDATLHRIGITLLGDASARVLLGGGSVQGVTGGPPSGLTMLRLGSSVSGADPLTDATILKARALPYAVDDATLAAMVAGL